MPLPKPKPCKACGELFQPMNGFTKACGIPCALELVARDNKRKQARERTAERKAHRADLKRRKAALLTINDYRRLAQKEFNRFIRVRDRNLPCVSCGKAPERGQRHASHYRPRSTAAQLSFNTEQVWASCAPCNSHKSGNLTEYRVQLIKRIGLVKVEALENNCELAKFTPEYLMRIRDIFRRRANLYEKIEANKPYSQCY